MKQTNYKNIFQLIPLPCLLLKPINSSSFIVTDANESFLELTGKKKTTLLRKPLSEVYQSSDIHFPEGSVIQDSLDQVLKSGEPNITETIGSKSEMESDEQFWRYKHIPILGSDRNVDCIIHILEDMTLQIAGKRKDKEEVKKQTSYRQQQFQHYIDESPDGLYSLDLKGNFITANKGLAEMTAISLDELLTLNFLTFCAPNDKEKILDHFERAIGGEKNNFEADFISAKGEPKIIRLSLSPMIIDTEVAWVSGIAKDITNIRATEKTILKKRKFLEVNAAFINSLLENELEDRALEETFGIIGKTVGVDRMYYFDAHTDESDTVYLSQKLEWTSDSAKSQKDNPEMQNIPAARVEEIMGPLTNNIPFTANLSQLKAGELRKMFIEQEIKAMLLLPIFLQDNLYGFIGFDDCQTEREWSENEVTFLQSLAHYFTTSIEKQAAQNSVQEKEKELRRSQEKFKAFVQEGSDLFAILDINGKLKFTSETSTSALGMSSSEFIGKNAFDFIHPEDRERIMKEFSELEKVKQKKSSPFRFRDQNGCWRWVETSATNLTGNPAVEGIIINSRDITTIVEQAEEIKQINERYVLAAAATQDLIYDWDLEKNKVVRFHSGSKNLLGHPTSEVDKNEFWQNHIHPDDFDRVNNILKSTLSDPKKDFIKTEFRFRRADGSYASLIDRGHIIRNIEGEAVRLIGATSDVSQITFQKEALKAANSRFKLAMKVTREMIWDWNIKADVVNRSKSFGKIYGYKTDDKSSMEDFWIPKIADEDRDRITESLEAALKDPKQNEWKEEYTFVKANGEQAFVMDRGYIIRDEKNAPVRMVGALLDVTASRRLIQDIKKQNEGLKEIAWAQSHVVRAPLARIKGLLHLLELEDVEEMSRADIVQHLHTSADELDEILREIVTKAEHIEISHEESEEV